MQRERPLHAQPGSKINETAHTLKLLAGSETSDIDLPQISASLEMLLKLYLLYQTVASLDWLESGITQDSTDGCDGAKESLAIGRTLAHSARM